MVMSGRVFFRTQRLRYHRGTRADYSARLTQMGYQRGDCEAGENYRLFKIATALLDARAVAFSASAAYYLGEDDDHGEERQRLDEGQAEHQEELDAGAGSRVAGQRFDG